MKYAPIWICFLITVFCFCNSNQSVAQTKVITGVPEGKTIEEFAKDKLVLTYDTIAKGRNLIFLIKGTPIDKSDYTRIWLNRIMYYSENETDYTTATKDKKEIGLHEFFYLGCIDSQDSLYFLRQLGIDNGYLFVCVGRNQENLWLYKVGRNGISIPGKDLFFSPKMDKVYTRKSDKTMYQFNFKLEILKQLNYFPKDLKPVFYTFPESDRLR